MPFLSRFSPGQLIFKSLYRISSTHPHLSQSPSYSSRTMSSSILKKPIKLACIQLLSGSDKSANLQHAASQVAKAAASGANLCILPECFNSPYGTQYFPSYAETLHPSPPTVDQSPSYHALSRMASDNSVYLVGGSIPELDPSTKKHYNTSLIFSPDGSLLASHRKVHLFDIDIPGGIKFKESDVLTAGDKVTLVDLPEYGKIAVAICYDIRFPELATIAARRGAFALVYPGAFNLVTGPLHWKLLGQARAVDNQIYVALCSPACNKDSTYHAYGHSMIVDPRAHVLTEAGDQEETVFAELTESQLLETRRNIPLNSQRRFDVYADISAEK